MRQSGSISAANEAFREDLSAHFTRQLEGRPDLLSKMLPNYPPGSKRMLRDSGRWASALRKPNVSVVSDRIERITKAGVMTADGVEHELDVLAFATGFEADNYLAGIDVIGRAVSKSTTTGTVNLVPSSGSPFPTSPTSSCYTGRTRTWSSTAASSS